MLSTAIFMTVLKESIFLLQFSKVGEKDGGLRTLFHTTHSGTDITRRIISMYRLGI